MKLEMKEFERKIKFLQPNQKLPYAEAKAHIYNSSKDDQERAKIVGEYIKKGRITSVQRIVETRVNNIHVFQYIAVGLSNELR